MVIDANNYYRLGGSKADTLMELHICDDVHELRGAINLILKINIQSYALKKRLMRPRKLKLKNK